MVFVNLGWYDPDTYLTSTGDLQIEQATYSGVLADNEAQNTTNTTNKQILQINNQMSNIK
jgi:hypothetical protein